MMTTGSMYADLDATPVEGCSLESSSSWPQDINNMHAHYGFPAAVSKLDPGQLRAFLNFRYAFLVEELDETGAAINEGDPEEIVDGLIDLCVVAIGTLDAFGVDAQKAWEAVLKANMAKEAGVNPTRPNELGLPDLMKPAGWTAPSHEGNHGFLNAAFK